VTFQVVMVVSMKVIAFWDVASCHLVEVDWRFRRVYCLHHKQMNDSLPWWWRHQSNSMWLHSAISQKALIFSVISEFVLQEVINYMDLSSYNISHALNKHGMNCMFSYNLMTSSMSAGWYRPTCIIYLYNAQSMYALLWRFIIIQYANTPSEHKQGSTVWQQHVAHGYSCPLACMCTSIHIIFFGLWISFAQNTVLDLSSVDAKKSEMVQYLPNRMQQVFMEIEMGNWWLSSFFTIFS
jgi:hypothetical protein